MKNTIKNIIRDTIKVRNLIIITFILGFNYGVFAQGYFTIGTGTSSDHNSPMNRGKNYSTSETIYLQSELGSGSYYFTKIAFNKKSGSNLQGIEDVTIYMKHTTDATLNDGNYSLVGYSKVFEGTFTNNASSGWMEVTLDNGFSYDGINNLQILIIKGYQNKTSHKPKWRYTQLSDYRSRDESDNKNQPTNLKNTKKRPNIRIEYDAPTQSNITIGTGTEASEKSPMNRKYNYSASEMIYLNSEIGRGYFFTKIAFYKKEGSNLDGIENVTIYFKHTSGTVLTDGNYSLTGYTQVFNGTFTNNAASGWMEVTLNSGFSYNGTDNLQILIIKGYQNKTSQKPEWSYTELSQERAREEADNNSQPTSLDATDKRPNIRLEYEYTNPVELTSFTAIAKDRNVTLKWTTAVELNNAGFEIERKSANDAQWTKIGFVKGNGTTNEPKNYTFTDAKLETGKYNYRLIQIDYNNASMVYDLSGTIDIGVPKKPELSQNYPNPFNPVTKIDYNLPFNGKVALKIYDITGREILTLVNETQTAGYHTVQFDASKLSSGTYFYRILTNDGQNNFEMTKKMLLVK